MKKSVLYGSMTGNVGTIDELKASARKNRKRPTQAESVLWEHLRHDFGTIRFRRQHVIGNYIVDFVSLNSKLVIEVDGDYHDEPEQHQMDEYRTSYLGQRGFTVIRFNNEEVINNIELVLERITKSLIPLNAH